MGKKRGTRTKGRKRTMEATMKVTMTMTRTKTRTRTRTRKRKRKTRTRTMTMTRTMMTMTMMTMPTKTRTTRTTRRARTTTETGTTTTTEMTRTRMITMTTKTMTTIGGTIGNLQTGKKLNSPPILGTATIMTAAPNPYGTQWTTSSAVKIRQRRGRKGNKIHHANPPRENPNAKGARKRSLVRLAVNAGREREKIPQGPRPKEENGSS